MHRSYFFLLFSNNLPSKKKIPTLPTLLVLGQFLINFTKQPYRRIGYKKGKYVHTEEITWKAENTLKFFTSLSATDSRIVSLNKMPNKKSGSFTLLTVGLKKKKRQRNDIKKPWEKFLKINRLLATPPVATWDTFYINGIIFTEEGEMGERSP